MKELIQALSNQGLITVVDIQRMTTLELLLAIIERVNELHGLTKEGLEAVQRLLDKGVQEEVIAQFDEWLQDGTFDTLINQTALNEVNERIDETNAQLSASIVTFESKLNEKANKNEIGSPLAVDSVSKMTDASRIYVLTTNGHWYSHNGSEWVDNGVYQSSGIADKSINNKMMADDYDDSGFLHEVDLNSVIRSGSYLVNSTCTNSPITTPSLLTVSNHNGRIMQIIRQLDNLGKGYVRIAKSSELATAEWINIVNNNAIDINSINADKLIDGTITRAKLKSGYDTLGDFTDADLSTLVDSGTYLLLGNHQNAPDDFTGTARLIVNVAGSQSSWIMQTLYSFMNPTCYYIRTFDKTNIVEDTWIKVPLLNDSQKANIDGSEGHSIDKALEMGNYLFFNSPSGLPTNIDFTSGVLSVELYANRWIYQRIIKLNDAAVQYARCVDIHGSDGGTYYDWVRLNASNSSLNLSENRILNCGDSIYGNYSGSTSISGYISSLSGAITINGGFGGCRMSQHAEYWDAFSMYRLADAFVSGDWSLQDQAIASSTNLPYYFSDRLSQLKELDLNTIDILTIAYGTNDYTAGVELDNVLNPTDTTTFKGALRYSLEKLMTAYPHLKILVCSQAYRFWGTEDGEFIEDSDTKYYNASQNTLPDFVKATEEVCKDYKVLFLNQYDNMGINKFNRYYYFTKTDGTHPNETGRKRHAERVVGFLSNN